MMDDKALISIVTPCFNEVGNIQEFYRAVVSEMDGKYQFELIFVDDGSTDTSLKIIKDICRQDKRFKYISFNKKESCKNLCKISSLVYSRLCQDLI